MYRESSPLANYWSDRMSDLLASFRNVDGGNASNLSGKHGQAGKPRAKNPVSRLPDQKKHERSKMHPLRKTKSLGDAWSL